MSQPGPGDPEETAPIRPEGWTTPSGGFVDLGKPTAAPGPPPAPPAVPTYQQPAYPQPTYPQPTYPQPTQPQPYQPQAYQPQAYQPQGFPQAYPTPAYGTLGYGYPGGVYLYGNRNNSQATTSMWLGIAGVVGAALTPFCCITLPLLVCSPIAWVLAVSSRKAIRTASPGTWSNGGQAQAGLILGIIGTVLGALAVLGVVLLFGFAYSTP